MTEAQVDLDQFRRDARKWIESNLERRYTRDTGVSAAEARTPEEITRSRKLQRTLFDAGWAGISYPEAYGGRGLSEAHERVFTEESSSYVTPDFGAVGLVTFGPIGRSMLAHATPAFLERHIPKMLAGEALWCQFYSEPEAGSDLAGIRTRATRDGENWVIRGSKIWTTGAENADYAMCLARTDWHVSKHRGLTWFAVPTSAKGVAIRPIVLVDGNAGFCEETLDDVIVSDTDIIGQINDGWSVAQTMLVYERRAGEGFMVSEPRELAPDLVALARKVNRLGDPIARQAIARAHINDYAQHHLGKRLFAALMASATPNPAVAAYIKLAGGTLVPQRVRLAMEIGGAATTAWDDGDLEAQHVVDEYLTGRIASIGGGTNEVQRNGIGERVLGLPREPSFDSTTPFADVVSAARNWNHRVG
ncbi:acyl-CoA dehydrogenase family protein [Mycolicibacterium vinylchloridicum]|uniref:acyl-CoA dehydrogenase family protein n=1 Tax=Mycolicibacterium vinylchloridicum TaxID=2736928 RepID=UPI001C5452FB|nr:acyl-CoA dehydrogenase family protein [Mycolicibacterium vinylchloridicum]